VISLSKAILAINPNASVVIRDEDVKKIEWQNGTKPIAEEDILAKQKELQTAYDKAKYQRDRAESYPSIGDQLDMIYHAGQGGDTFQKAIKAVKDKYPKG
tara:strand:- start:18 stop:317 length:300 start_codon:yes stop_codon:yes gene_type:complete